MRPFAILYSALLLSSCGYYYEKRDGAADELNRATTAADFAAVQSAIFAPHCVSCHQQYSSYAQVRRELSAISAAVTANRMPKSGGPLSSGQKQLLQTWIAAGAPEVADRIPETPLPIPLEANYDSIAANILIPKCTVCHNPAGQAKFLDLSSYEAIQATRERRFGPNGDAMLFDTEIPERSYILEVIQDPIEPMPPRSTSISPLTEKEISVLTEWIGQGLVAKHNRIGEALRHYSKR